MSTQTLKLLAEISNIAHTVPDGSFLLSTGFSLRHPELHSALLQHFGSWEVVLAQLVVYRRDREQFESQIEESETSTEQSIRIEDIQRQRDPAADHGLWGVSNKGQIVRFSGPQLPISPQPISCVWPEDFGHLLQVVSEDGSADISIFTKHGWYFGLHRELAPNIDNLPNASPLQALLDLQADDGAIAIVPSRYMRQRDVRLLHVTAMGKGKATEISEYSVMMGKKGREAFLLNPGDVPKTVLIGDEFDGLFCVSAMGQGIHIATRDLRTMGRKSVGVNLMKLEEESDAVVSAFLTNNIEQIAVITAQGFAKRLDFKEYRRQGRGGTGMQVARLYPQDQVIGAVPCSDLCDLLFTTCSGRVWRIASVNFPLLGRATRGKRMIDLLPTESVVSLSALPCSG
jgi:DNA gyrase/topoisomerase IV subunit A